MESLRHLPIQRKLTLVIALSSMATLLLAVTTLFVFQWFYARSTITRDLLAQAEIIAANSTAALSFQDEKAATEILTALKSKPHILCACLYLPNRKLLAHYGAPEEQDDLPPAPVKDGFYFEGPHLVLIESVLLDHRCIGTLMLRFDFQALRNEVTRPYLAVLGFILPACLLLALLLSSRLQGLISQPILQLAATARVVAEQKDYTVRAQCESRDELGLLTGAFNQMLARLEEDDSALRRINVNLQREIAERQQAQAELEALHKQMLDVSREAGMAEVATGVLHNIGNVLNSVNVSCNLVLDRLRQSKLAHLAKVNDLLATHAADLGQFLGNDEKGRLVPGYLVALSQHLTEEQALCLRELDSLRSHIDHIKDIVTMQQDYAKVAGVVETIPVQNLIEDAIKLNAGALARHKVTIQRDYQETPAITVEKHRVLQILVNLIRNAKYALDESGCEDKIMTFRTGSNGHGCIHIQIADNGVGIPAENLTRIFAHGFTTRAHGHGFGLHSGALAARELGGWLQAQSDGPGCGATFTLELPLQPKKRS